MLLYRTTYQKPKISFSSAQKQAGTGFSSAQKQAGTGGEPKERREQSLKLLQEMTTPRFSPLIFLHLSVILITTHFIICNGFPVSGTNSTESSEIDAMPRRVCGGRKVGACSSAVEEDEGEMDSETNRRVLAMRRRYISYDTLRRDMILCEKPGASYYNCHPRQANPYHRGCEAITYCARDVNDIRT